MTTLSRIQIFAETALPTEERRIPKGVNLDAVRSLCEFALNEEFRVRAYVEMAKTELGRRRLSDIAWRLRARNQNASKALSAVVYAGEAYSSRKTSGQDLSRLSQDLASKVNYYFELRKAPKAVVKTDDLSSPKEFPSVKILANQTDYTNKELCEMVGLPSGFKGKLRAENITGRQGEITVSVSGSGISMLRSYIKGDLNSWSNEDFSIYDGSPYKKHGAEILHKQVEALSRLGFKKITTFAGGSGDGTLERKSDTEMVGYYAWARLGYVPHGKFADKFVKDFNKESKSIKAKSFEDIMVVKEGREWFYKNGTFWSGVFDLAPGSYSRRILNSVVAERKNRR